MATLLVGEGDFSFAVKFSETEDNFVASCLLDVNPNCESMKKNIEILQAKGIIVRTDVDARKLDNLCEIIKEKGRFRRIIFNFPHIGGKMHIGKNRELIKDFFIACQLVLGENGRVELALCSGQGGTPIDKKRNYNDTWKVTHMAAYGGFVLVDVKPFGEIYNNVGYRSLNKSFNVQGALLHTFQFAGRPPSLRDSCSTFDENFRLNGSIPRNVKFPIVHTIDFSFWSADVTNTPEIFKRETERIAPEIEVVVKGPKDVFRKEGRISWCFTVTLRCTHYSMSHNDVVIGFVNLLKNKLLEWFPEAEARC